MILNNRHQCSHRKNRRSYQSTVVVGAWCRTHNLLERSTPTGDNVGFPRARTLHTLQATKKQDKEPDHFPSSCRYRIEESKG